MPRNSTSIYHNTLPELFLSLFQREFLEAVEDASKRCLGFYDVSANEYHWIHATKLANPPCGWEELAQNLFLPWDRERLAHHLKEYKPSLAPSSERRIKKKWISEKVATIQSLSQHELHTLHHGGDLDDVLVDEVILEPIPSSNISMGVVEGVGVVFLNTTITPDLRREGVMREMIRHLQLTRKALGLHLTSRVRASFCGDGVVAEVLQEPQLLGYLCKELLVEIVDTTTTTKDHICQTIDGDKFWFRLIPI